MIYVPLIYFSSFLLIQKRKNKTFLNIGSVITLYYIVSSVFCIIMYNNNSGRSMWSVMPELKIIPTALYCILLSYVIKPFYDIKIENNNIVGFKRDNQAFRVVSWTLIVMNFIYLAWIVPNILTVLRGDLGTVRTMYYSGEIDLRVPYIMLPFYYAKEFSPVLLLFYFYNSTFEEESRVFNILLLIASLVQPLSSIIVASRTQIIYWVMTLSVLLAIFRFYMTKKNKRLSLILLTAMLVIFIMYISNTTVSRFAGTDFGVDNSVITYIGQPYLAFCKVYNHYTFDGILTFDRTFPIISDLFRSKPFSLTDYRAYHTARIGTATGVFLTFLGDIMLDFGKIGMIIYTLIIGGIIRRFVNRIRKEQFDLSTLIFLTIVFRIPLLGFFADMYLSIGSSIFIVGSIVICYLFRKTTIVFRSHRKIL